MNRALLTLVLTSTLAACSSSSSNSQPGDAGDDSSTIFDTSANDAQFQDLSPIADSADASTSIDADAGPQKLTCAFVNDDNNCWRVLVASIDTCLPNGAGVSLQGTFSSDHTTCSYPFGRTVTFNVPVDPSVPAGDSAERDYTLESHTHQTCMHYIEHAGTSVSFTVTGPDGGVFTMTTNHNDMTITCPDGSQYEGDTSAVTKLCGIQSITGGLPAHDVYQPGTGELRFELNGEVSYAFDCVEAAGDAGTDGGP